MAMMSSVAGVDLCLCMRWRVVALDGGAIGVSVEQFSQFLQGHFLHCWRDSVCLFPFDRLCASVLPYQFVVLFREFLEDSV